MAIWQSEHPPEPAPIVLAEAHRGALERLLCRDVVSNLFMLCWLDNHGVAARGRSDLFHFAGVRDAAGQLLAASLCVTGRLALVDALTPQAAAALGRWYRRRAVRFEHIVSARHAVTPFWTAYRDARGPGRLTARLDRDQRLLVVERDRWEEVRAERRERFEPTGIGFASLADLEAVFLASARMHREETLEDPLRTAPEDFRRHVRHRIETNRCFAWFGDHRKLTFKADVSARSSYGVQLSGVYTPPDLRGQGLATRAMFDICEHLFEAGAPRVTLYVNAENAAALRVYDKVGFVYRADYETVFVVDEDDAA